MFLIVSSLVATCLVVSGANGVRRKTTDALLGTYLKWLFGLLLFWAGYRRASYGAAQLMVLWLFLLAIAVGAGLIAGRRPEKAT